MRGPLMFVNWYAINQLFRSLMWIAVLFLILFIVGHLLPESHQTTQHVVIRTVH